MAATAVAGTGQSLEQELHTIPPILVAGDHIPESQAHEQGAELETEYLDSNQQCSIDHEHHKEKLNLPHSSS